MVQVPSIKGSVFSGHAEQLRKLVSAGEVSRQDLARRLEPSDLTILDNPIHATQWYDIRTYERIVMLRRDLEGDGGNECLLRFGAESAERLLRGGIYQQFDYLQRTEVAKHCDAKARFVAFGRDLRLLVSLHATILNFSRVEVKIDPEWDDRYVIEHADAIGYPEVLCWTTQGFFNRMAVEHGEGALWRWERPSPDRVLYRMNRAI
jgi:hypothetical protein